MSNAMTVNNSTYGLKGALVAFLFLFLLCACSEDTLGLFGDGEGNAVTLSLDYKGQLNRELVVTRATTSENALNNLQVFIFDKNGKLKGYKYLDYAELKQDGSVGTFNIKTTTGDAYIYAVANAQTSIYSLATTGKSIPTSAGEWSEEDAQVGNIDFTLDDLRAIAFSRAQGQKDITEANFMMSGTANGGQLCTIAKSGNGLAHISQPTSQDEQLIKLHRVVAKVTFNVKTGTTSKSNTKIAFTPTTYDFCNVPFDGSLIEGAGIAPQTFENFTGGSYSAQTPGVFETYLPENLQAAKTGAVIANWNDREADSGEGESKAFTKAPDHGSYVALHGTYTETNTQTNAITRDATVTYYIHLGDFKTNLYDFDVTRNTHYTYNVTVNGVDSIVVQVQKQNDDVQPGAEGMVFDYSTGSSFTLDSHYDYCVMQFNRDELNILKSQGYGYTFKVKALDENGTLRESGKIVVRDNSTLDAEQQSELNGVDISWARFLKGGTYNRSNSHGGADPDYRTLRNANGYASGQTDVGMNIVELLAHLYNLPDNSSEWDSNGNTTYTCYVSENYYDKFAWGKYVNIDPRMLYIANEVTDSPDDRSVYATVKYTLQQHSIKTFYNTANDGTLVAYGLETIRDDHKTTPSSWDKTASNGYDYWDGLANMKKDIPTVGSGQWSNVNYNQLRQACMSRNRDLNGNGIIDANEVRWYCPAIDQYTGMWIGENALTDTKVRCYNGNTTTLSDASGYLARSGAEHYFSNTHAQRVFWAEEGSATGDEASNDKALNYVRCIRNMKSNDLAIGTSADKYYEWDGQTVDMSRIATEALRTNVQSNELLPHTERGLDKSIANIARKFTYAKWTTAGDRAKNDTKSLSKIAAVGTSDGKTSMLAVTTDERTICESYTENGTSTGWRAPNQRELCMMSIIGAYSSNQWEGCRTSFSGTLRYTWIVRNNHVDMGNWTKASAANSYVAVRCVKDTK